MIVLTYRFNASLFKDEINIFRKLSAIYPGPFENTYLQSKQKILLILSFRIYLEFKHRIKYSNPMYTRRVTYKLNEAGASFL